MSPLSKLIKSLGGLHDVKVTSFIRPSSDRVLILELGDIYRNFAGLDGYKGPMPGVLRATGVDLIYASVSGTVGHLNIYEMKLLPSPSENFTVEIAFWPSGLLKFTAVEIGLIDARGTALVTE